MSNPEWETKVRWRSADDPPEVPKGHIEAVIVARKFRAGGGWHVFGAWYLNRFELEDANDMNAAATEFTGFHDCKETPEYDEYFEPIEVDFWAPMPSPPSISPDKIKSVSGENTA